ncbi:MAG: HAD-IA family hydrolase [Thermoanaerobaculia bacterium]|nr:HAD-IA family hydrolase [Thermoanaerobaculia bacterium]
MPQHENNSEPDRAGARIEAVTFDVTRTLIHAPRLGEIYREVLARHGIEVEPRAVETRVRLVWEELECRSDPRRDRFGAHPQGARGFWHDFVVRLCQHLEVGVPTRFATAELFDRFAKAGGWELYPDVIPVLGTLRELGLRLGVISNWDPRLPGLLEQLDLARFFEVVCFSAQTGVEKPHPKIFYQCLEVLGLEPGCVLHVGDRQIEDVESAQAIGMSAFKLDRKRPDGGLHGMLAALSTRAALWRDVAEQR